MDWTGLLLLRGLYCGVGMEGGTILLDQSATAGETLPGIYFAAGLGGWMRCMKASGLTEARAIALATAESASLLASDIHTIRPATADDLAHYEAMGGVL